MNDLYMSYHFTPVVMVRIFRSMILTKSFSSIEYFSNGPALCGVGSYRINILYCINGFINSLKISSQIV